MEPQDRGGDLVGLVELRQMRGAFDDPDLGLAADRLGDDLGVAPRQDAVLLAPQDQGRRHDEREAPLEPGVAQRPEDACRGLGRAGLLDRPFDRIGAGGHLLERLVDLGPRGHEGGNLVGLLRPRVGRGVILVVEAEGGDQRQPPDLLGPDRRHLGGERAADRAAGEIGAGEAGLVDEVADRQHPIEMGVEHGMAAVAARKARQGGHDHRARLGEAVEKRDPLRQAAEAGEKPDARARALAPDARGKPVDVDDRRLAAHTAYSRLAAHEHCVDIPPHVPAGVPSPLAPTRFPSPLRRGVRGGGNPLTSMFCNAPTLSLPARTEGTLGLASPQIPRGARCPHGIAPPTPQPLRA